MLNAYQRNRKTAVSFCFLATSPSSKFLSPIYGHSVRTNECKGGSFVGITRVASTLKEKQTPSRYFPIFESTFEKGLMQLSVELIQLDIVYDSLNYTEYRVKSALPRVESNIFRKLIQTSENIWIWGLFFFQCSINKEKLEALECQKRRNKITALLNLFGH